MIKDNFVSIGIVVHKKTSKGKVIDLHEIMKTNFSYFEIILIDLDNSIKKTNKFISLKNIRILELSSKVDIEDAYNSIIENCIGDYLTIIDVNHDPVSSLLNFLEKSFKYDIIIGKCIKKRDSITDLFFSNLFYSMISSLTGVKIDKKFSDYISLNRRVINFIINKQEKVKYLKLSVLKERFSIFEFDYSPIGKKSYKRNLFSNINFSIDVLVSFSDKLIRIATILSLLASIINLIFLIYVLVIFFFKNDVVEGWASSNIFNSVVFFILFLVMSILGEYIRVVLKNQKRNNEYQIINERSNDTIIISEKNIDN